MAVNAAGFNYLPTTNSAGSFPGPDSSGWVQGTFIDDPAIRSELVNGVLGQSETIPMWGGVGIYENVPAAGGAFQLGGGVVGRATNLTANTALTLTGFSVFNQAIAWVTSPASQVPTAGSGMTVPFFRLGCGARIAVACDPALISLQGSIIVPQVSWDFGAQRLCLYTAAYPAATPSAYNSYTSATGILQLTFSAAPGPLVGNSISLTGFAGAQAPFNGTWLVSSTASAGTVLNIQTTPGLGSISLSGAAGTLVAGGGALPVKVLDVNPSNSMTVGFAPATNLATWNRTGAAALILI